MESKNIDTLKALLNVLTAAGVSKYESGPGGAVTIEFHRTPTVPVPQSAPVTVPKDPVQQQLATRNPAYAHLFPGGFPTHAPHKAE